MENTAMMNKLFLDTNVVMDAMEYGREHSTYSSLILGFCNVFNLCISVQTFSDIAYIVRKEYSGERVKHNFEILMNHCTVLTMLATDFARALQSKCPDMEDAMQISCAETTNCDAIITANKKHFSAYTDIPVYTPKEFIEALQAAQ